MVLNTEETKNFDFFLGGGGGGIVEEDGLQRFIEVETSRVCGGGGSILIYL